MLPARDWEPWSRRVVAAAPVVVVAPVSLHFPAAIFRSAPSVSLVFAVVRPAERTR